MPLEFQSRWAKVADILFDVGSAILALVDIASDFAVLINFYTEGHMPYFYVSLSFLCIVQIAYAKLFTNYYVPYEHPYPNLVFLGALLIGQLIPIVMLLVSFEFEWLKRIFEKFKLDFTGSQAYVGPDEDPLKQYLAQKLAAHGPWLVSLRCFSHSMSLGQVAFW